MGNVTQDHVNFLTDYTDPNLGPKGRDDTEGNMIRI